jgi:hypothetical protein
MKNKQLLILSGWFILLGSFISLANLNAQNQSKPKSSVPKKEMHQTAKGSAPELVSPAENAVLTNFPRETKFEWKAVTGAKSYELEVEINDGQWKMLKKEKCVGLNAMVNFTGDNPGRWRVRAVYEDGTYSPWKGSEFKYKTTNPNSGKVKPENNKSNKEKEALLAPELVSPKEGTRFSNFPREIKFNWTQIPGVLKYEVQIECKEGSAWKLVKKEIVETSNYTFNFVGAQPGRWRVCGIAEGKKSIFSSWREFICTK